MGKTNFIMFLGIALIIANAITSGALANIWSTVKGAPSNITTVPGTGGATITHNPDGSIAITPQQLLPGNITGNVGPNGQPSLGVGPFRIPLT